MVSVFHWLYTIMDTKVLELCWNFWKFLTLCPSPLGIGHRKESFGFSPRVNLHSLFLSTFSIATFSTLYPSTTSIRHISPTVGPPSVHVHSKEPRTKAINLARTKQTGLNFVLDIALMAVKTQCCWSKLRTHKPSCKTHLKFSALLGAAALCRWMGL